MTTTSIAHSVEILESCPDRFSRQSEGPELSVIIVNWNARNHLRECLASLKTHLQGLETEVIVVDNDSQDGSKEMIEREFSQVILIANDENRGFAAANNQGLVMARGRWLLLLNPDTEINARSIHLTLTFAQAHRQYGVVGCRAIRPDGTQQSTMFRYPRLRDAALNVVFPNRLMRKLKWLGGARYLGTDLEQVQEAEVIAGCFMLLSAEVYRRVGGLDEGFFMYGEEAEFCHRIRGAGWGVAYYPEASILHHGGISADQIPDEMNLTLARSQLLLYQRTRGSVVAWFANLLMLFRDLPRAIIGGVVLIIPGISSVRRTLLKRSVRRCGLHLRGVIRLDWSV